MPSNKNAQTMLSSYFSPSPTKCKKRPERPESPIDLTSDAEDIEGVPAFAREPPIKKIKVARLSQSQPRASTSAKPKKPSGTTNYTQSTLFSRTLSPDKRYSTPSCSKSTGMAEQWAFSSQPTPTQTLVPGTEGRSEHDAKKARRHELFMKKLLVHDFGEQPYESGAPEYRPAGQESDGEASPPARMTMVQDGKDDDDQDQDSDPGFEKLMKSFSSSSSTARGKRKEKNSPKEVSVARGKTSAKAGKRTKKPPPQLGPSGEEYTPLERQVLQLKTDNPGTLLMIEVGYRYKFFGNDAKTAAKELSIVAYPDRNFTVASIPVERLNVHLRKLLAKGHRVGVVNQIETAALKKVSDNRAGPFERKLTHLYTAATFVDELDSVDEDRVYTPPPFMCLIEEPGSGNTGSVKIAMIVVCPSTGDVVWDDFEDSLMRTELETRLVHTRPAELLMPDRDLSEPTSKMLKFFSRNSATGDKLRLEYVERVMPYSMAFSLVSKFYADKHPSSAASDAFQSGRLMAEITDFPPRVVIALAHAVQYLSDFGLADPLLETKFFTKFTTRTHMLIAANTLVNLEIYRNDTDYRTEGSLIHVLDKTLTKFGARLLKSWVGRPLVDKEALQKRVDAIEEIIGDKSDRFYVLRYTLQKLPDLSKGLCRIQYGQCTPKELATLLPAFAKIANAYREFTSPDEVGFKSPILNDIIYALPKLKPVIEEFVDAVRLDKAEEGRQDLMWQDSEKFPGLDNAFNLLAVVEAKLEEELKTIRKGLRMPSLEWTTHLNDEYLIEVQVARRPPIPDNWVIHSKTKKVARYRPATVGRKVEERARCLEMIQMESQKAYQGFLQDMSTKCYTVLRNAINKLAEADCLQSLARVASEKGYIKPEFTDDDSLEIVEGRHPIIEVISDKPYFSNSITMGFGQPRSKLITGPNMGGKSSFVRMVALIVLMAQVGSYVPAQSVRMGLHDSILTRMGASDDLAKGRSTFMVEMAETSEILHEATSRSLVILDELGRGTSTFDGMAIADGVLQQLVGNTRSKTLFITHYPVIASAIERKYPQDIENIHMGYRSEVRLGGKREITFLYKVEKGITTESFGIECARLASMPEALLEAASGHAEKFQTKIEGRIRRNKVTKAVALMNRSRQEEGSQQEAVTLEELRCLAQSLSMSTT